jgi:hypothetical protein
MDSTSLNSIGSNGCNGPVVINSYYDLFNLCPRNPLEMIANASLNGTVGALTNSTSYASETWADSGAYVAINQKPAVTALGSDNGEKVADAAQWNFLHLTWNSDPGVPLPLQRTIFLRAGTDWNNRIYLTFGSLNINLVQLSFLNNAATRGDKQGTIPVIQFTGPTWTGSGISLDVVIRQPTIVRMGLCLRTTASVFYMFDMEWIVVP